MPIIVGAIVAFGAFIAGVLLGGWMHSKAAADIWRDGYLAGKREGESLW